MPADRFTVLLKGLQTYSYHGVTAEEQAVGHRFSISISAEVLGDADSTDRLEGTVSYADLASIAVDQMGAPPLRTVEALANRIAVAILQNHAQVANVTIELCKLAPPMPYIVEEAGVILRRTRS